MTKLKLESLVSHSPLGRDLTLDDVENEFRLIREAQKEKVSSAGDFQLVGERSGTHLLKLVSSRVASGQHVLRFPMGGDKKVSHFLPSADPRQSAAAKIAFRPLEIEGGEPKSLVDHLLYPDNRSTAVIEAFSNVYGEECCNSLKAGLESPLAPIELLPAQEFPIIFLPHSAGIDVQATPVSPAVTFNAMHRICSGYFKLRRDDPSIQLRDRWHYQHVTSKQQNVSSAIGQKRVRFAARMPGVLNSWDAMLYRFAQGGSFPRWDDESVPLAVRKYAELLNRRDEYSNKAIRDGLDRRAFELVQDAKEFIDDTIREAQETFPGTELNASPSIADVLLRRRWRNDDERDQARQALTSPHFKSLVQRVLVD